MEAARNASEKSEEFQVIVQLMTNMTTALYEIRDLLKTPKKDLDDQDIEDMAVHFLIQCGPNLSEIVRKMEQQGIHVRRQSLAEAKKFARFQEKLEVFRRGELRRGFTKDDGGIEAID